ncbi:hypothetical protein D3C86_571590 [compost metagenome]
MHHHLRVVERDQAVGLVAVREEGARHGLADDQADHGMAGQARLGVSACRAGQRLVNTIGFFTPAIRLAGHVDDGDDGAFHGQLAVFKHHLPHGARQLPRLDQADFTRAGARKTVVRVGQHGNVARRFARQRRVDHAHGRRIAVQRRGMLCQGREPDGAAARIGDGVHAAVPLL